MISAKIPVTILTGFLGAGKTTLLNRILSEQHGKRIAVIENEYGEIGIDQGLVIDADEEIFEMSNGCVCCTVRGDLIRILGNLAKRRDRFDYVLVETTGLADPGPVAQTFFMDEDVREEFALDGIVTLVDAKHIELQLGHSKESKEQIAFADVLVLNKTDLVQRSMLDALEPRLRGINAMARIHRAEHGRVALDHILNLQAFDLQQALARKPTFLEPEYPFEWSSLYRLTPGRYRLLLEGGPDPMMSIVILPMAGTDEDALSGGAERCVRLYAEPAVALDVENELSLNQHHTLQLQASGDQAFCLAIRTAGVYGLYTQHLAEEFDLRLVDGDGQWVPPLAGRSWVAQHQHDDEVCSVGLEAAGDVDAVRLNLWLTELLSERGVDIFRMKGFISIADNPDRFVFQGVHMLFNGQPHRPWGDEPRHNQLVFIGRNLDRRELQEGFRACLI
ncbi:MAG: CobW family GTP-binding protein [Gammaproteobacteria bacterium]